MFKVGQPKKIILYVLTQSSKLLTHFCATSNKNKIAFIKSSLKIETQIPLFTFFDKMSHLRKKTCAESEFETQFWTKSESLKWYPSWGAFWPNWVDFNESKEIGKILSRVLFCLTVGEIVLWRFQFRIKFFMKFSIFRTKKFFVSGFFAQILRLAKKT